MINNTIQLNNFLTPPSTELSPFLLADNQLCIANGINLSYKLGTIIKDLGYSKVGSTLEANKPLTGLYHFRQSPSVNKVLATINNSAGTDLVLQYNNAGTWTAIDTSTTWNAFEDAKVEMESFIGYCFFVGYDSTDGVFLPVGTLTGTTFSTSTNCTSMPQGKFVKRYRDRIYVANCYYSAAAYPYRVFYSSVPSAGAITWTPDSDFFDVDFSEQITGIGENWDRLVVFTDFSAYFYDQSSKKKTFDIGCANHRTIKNFSSYLIWANKDNIWVSTGGQPQAIGNDIKELIRNSTLSNWTSEIIDDEYCIYLGNTEANGLSYANCLATYSFSTGMWRWRELYNDIKILAKYTDGVDDFLYMGSSDGMVHVKSKYTDTTPVYTDNTKPIVAHFRTKAFDFGDPSVMKTINKIVSYCNSGQGVMIRFRVWNKNNEVASKWQDIGQLVSVINTYDKSITGNMIQLEGKEFSTRQAFEFYGLTLQLGQDSKL